MVKKICIVFFLVLIMGVFMVSAEGTEVVLGKTAEIGEGEKTPDNPYRIEGYTPESVIVGDTVYGLDTTPMYGNSEYQDSYDVVTGEETRQWSVVTYDGTETWYLYDDGETIYYSCFYTYGFYQDSSVTPICTHFSVFPISYNDTNIGFYTDSNVTRFRPDMTRFPDLETWKSWLAEQSEAGTPLQILYKLQEPTVVQHEPIVIGNRYLLTIQDALSWVVGNVLTVIQIVALDPVLMLGLSVWCIGGVVFLFRRLV